MLQLIERDEEQRASQRQRRYAQAEFQYRSRLFWIIGGSASYLVLVMLVVEVFGK